MINNAGMAGGGPYFSIKPYTISTTLTVNYYAQVKLEQSLIPTLRGRKHQSAIVNMASCSGYFVAPLVGAYSAGKKMTDISTRILSLEN